MPSTAPEQSARLDVVAAIMRDADGRVLLARRPEHKHQGGRWEFPGGKVEQGEALDHALARELDEELGIQVQTCQPFMTVDHHYPDLHVRLHFREVLGWQGAPHGCEGQAVEWFAIEQLAALEFPAANRPVVKALQLSDFVLVLPDVLPDDINVRLDAAIQRGCRVIYLRSTRHVSEQAIALVQRCRQQGALTLVRNDLALMHALGADGLHLSAAVAREMATRPAVKWLSLACHDEEEIATAARLRADMLLLSPVNLTSTHPQATALGWQQFSALATGQPCAVYALGGVGPDDLLIARQHGARGVAGIRAFL
jgi:8-oxo-dGTP diphosphatase